MNYDPRIVKWAPYGQHIKLACRNHPELRWSTKNIDNIGARSIFFLGVEGETEPFPSSPECSCSVLDLHPVVPDNPVEVPY